MTAMMSRKQVQEIIDIAFDLEPEGDQNYVGEITSAGKLRHTILGLGYDWAEGLKRFQERLDHDLDSCVFIALYAAYDSNGMQIDTCEHSNVPYDAGFYVDDDGKLWMSGTSGPSGEGFDIKWQVQDNWYLQLVG